MTDMSCRNINDNKLASLTKSTDRNTFRSCNAFCNGLAQTSSYYSLFLADSSTLICYCIPSDVNLPTTVADQKCAECTDSDGNSGSCGTYRTPKASNNVKTLLYLYELNTGPGASATQPQPVVRASCLTLFSKTPSFIQPVTSPSNDPNNNNPATITTSDSSNNLNTLVVVSSVFVTQPSDSTTIPALSQQQLSSATISQPTSADPTFRPTPKTTSDGSASSSSDSPGIPMAAIVAVSIILMIVVILCVVFRQPITGTLKRRRKPLMYLHEGAGIPTTVEVSNGDDVTASTLSSDGRSAFGEDTSGRQPLPRQPLPPQPLNPINADSLKKAKSAASLAAQQPYYGELPPQEKPRDFERSVTTFHKDDEDESTSSIPSYALPISLPRAPVPNPRENPGKVMEWSRDEVASWLLSVGVGHSFVDIIHDKQVTGYTLLLLSESKLVEIGISVPTARRLILHAVDDLRGIMTAPPGHAPTDTHHAVDAPPTYN
ncbi:hypothetical protein HDU97_002295 [Phlyctochytrium planicorne]|nr:hypothetical protein HDU97_002295 [Phlyctochytrium planicorne]